MDETRNNILEWRESAESARIIAETASDAIITIDTDSRILFANRAVESVFGYSVEELVGQNLTILMPEYLRHVHRSGIKRYVETGEKHIPWQAVELPGLHKNGREIVLELSFGEFTRDGRRFFTGIARDITRRKSNELQLALQNSVTTIIAKGQSLSETAREILKAVCLHSGWDLGEIWIVNPEPNELECFVSWHSPAAKVTQFVAAGRNLRLKKGTGVPGRIWEKEEPLWLGERDLATNFPRAAQATQENLHSAFGVPISFQREILGVINFFSQKTQRPDQSLIKTLNIISSQFGQFIERKRGEEQRARLLAQEQEARQLAEATSAQLRALQRVTDAALAHLSLKDLLPELLGRIRVALKVDTVAILLLEKEGDELVAWAALGLEEEVERGVRIPVGKGFAGRIIAQGRSITINDVSKADVHNPLLREKGIVSLLGVPLWVAGRAIGVLHVGTLQAHRFTAEEESLLQLVADRIAVAIENSRLYEVEQSARVEAERLNRLKDDFLAVLSHELRTPLTPIIGWLNMMETGILAENDYERAVAVMGKNADSLKHLINDLLDMSAILSGKMRVEENVVSLADVLREATESMRVYAGESDIELRLSAGNDELLVKGDKTRLVQVFSNLLQNAIKFSVAGGVVGVSIRADPKEVVATVADTGQGMSADFVPHVFERFRQEDGSRTRVHGGLGLGLALVKSFVEAHGGNVVASSEGIGKGSKFSVTLPLLSNEDTRTFRESVLASGDGNENMRAQILIVEDQADTREMLVNLFRSHGFGAHSCESALDALETVKEKRFDLIVSDIAMPTMDGLELMRELRQLASAQETPAIALSGYASERDVQAALAAGFNMHVAKPVGPEELIRLARKLMEKSPPIDLDSGSLIG